MTGWAPYASVAFLAAVHLFAHHADFMHRDRENGGRSAWLSAAGGAAVAYVFLHILPRVQGGRDGLPTLPTADVDIAWSLALAGLVSFYALETLVRQAGDEDEPDSELSNGLRFWTHLGVMSFYSGLIGFLILKDSHRGTEQFLFALALGLHFVVTDQALRNLRPEFWLKIGRWALTAALAAGLGLAMLFDPPQALTNGLFAFLAGAIMLNVMKEELPSEAKSELWPFLLGAGLYSGLLFLAW